LVISTDASDFEANSGKRKAAGQQERGGLIAEEFLDLHQKKQD